MRLVFLAMMAVVSNVKQVNSQVLVVVMVGDGCNKEMAAGKCRGFGTSNLRIWHKLWQTIFFNL